MSSDPRPTVRPETEPPRPRLLPPYHVILLNDDYHSGEFVVLVLCEVLRLSEHQALALALEAHDAGRAIIWTGPKEVAELKLEQILTFREDRGDVRLGPLHCALEPAA